jgi:hypothetical protein
MQRGRHVGQGDPRVVHPVPVVRGQPGGHHHAVTAYAEIVVVTDVMGDPGGGQRHDEEHGQYRDRRVPPDARVQVPGDHQRGGHQHRDEQADHGHRLECGGRRRRDEHPGQPAGPLVGAGLEPGRAAQQVEQPQRREHHTGRPAEYRVPGRRHQRQRQPQQVGPAPVAPGQRVPRHRLPGRRRRDERRQREYGQRVRDEPEHRGGQVEEHPTRLPEV